MGSGAHSECDILSSVLVKNPAQAFGSQETIDGKWASLNYFGPPDYQEALKEFDQFETEIKSSGAEVLRLGTNDKVTMDSIYVRDASVITDFGAIICNMGKTARHAEPEAQHSFFQENGIGILGKIEPPSTLEGGDTAWIDEKTLAVGWGYRTNAGGIEQLRALLKPMGIEVLVVHLPHYLGPGDVFHLMSIFSPVDRDLAVIYSPLMPVPFRTALIECGYQFVEVSKQEFEMKGCNVLALAPRKCLMLEGIPETRKLLEEKGVEVITYKGNEISNMGNGGPTCLTRPLTREA